MRACLRHPYLQTYHDDDDEPECEEIYDESIEREERDVEGWRLLTWEEYNSFEPPIFDSSDEEYTDGSDAEYSSSDDEKNDGDEQESYDNAGSGMVQH